MRKIRKVFILLWFPVIFCCFFIEQVFSMNDTHSWTFAQKAMGQNYSSGQLMTYAVPEEYPLEGSQKFNVSVNGYYTGIYNDNNLWGGNVNFGYFDFEAGNSVNIVVSYSGSIDSFEILPKGFNIQAEKVSDNALSFQISNVEQYITVIINGNYKGDVLHLFANSIDKNIPNVAQKEGYYFDKKQGIHYFGPGYYKLSEMFSNGTLSVNKKKVIYLAGGAVLDGQLGFNQSSSAEIRGRGMIMNKEEKGMDNRVVLSVSASTGGTIEGIIIHGHRAPGWVCTNDKSSGLSYRNVKIISTRYASTDGIDINQCTDFTFENMFIRSCDDAVAIKGLDAETSAPVDCRPNKNLLFEKMQLWNDCNNAFGMGAETRASLYENISLRNSDILFSYDDPNYHETLDERSAMNICALHGTYFRNIVFENIRVNRCERLIGLGFKDNFWFGSIQGDQSYPGGIDGVIFRNIICESNSGSKIANDIWLYGWYKEGTPTKQVKNITFDNVIIEGNLLQNDQSIKTNNVSGIILVKDLFFNTGLDVTEVREKYAVKVYPTILNQGENIYLEGDPILKCSAYSSLGQLLGDYSGKCIISTAEWPSGINFIKILDGRLSSQVTAIIVR